MVSPSAAFCVAMKSTLAKNGVAILQHALACPTSDEELAASRQLRQRAGIGPSATHHWKDNWLCRDYSRHKQTLTDTHRYQQEHLGNFNIHGLLHANILGSVDRINSTTARFQLRESVSPSPVAARSFRLLCDLLDFSYPAMLLLRSDGHSALRARPDAEIEWAVRVTGFNRELVMNRGPGDEVLGTVHSMHDAERLARRHRVGHKIKFDPHPSLSAILPVWDSQRLARGRELRAIVAATAWARAKQATADRVATAAAEHAPIAAALSSVSWKNIHKMPHTTSRQRLCLFQVKSGRLNGYTQVLDKHGCPHCPQIGAIGGKASHIMWTCPQAQLLWRTIRALWKELGAWVGHDAATENKFLQAVFRVKLSAVPTKAWDLLTLARLDHNQHRGATEVYPTLQSVWQQHVLTTFTTIMQWRQGMHDEHRAWSRRQAQGNPPRSHPQRDQAAPPRIVCDRTRRCFARSPTSKSSVTVLSS